jgi:hypothetical protein
MNTRIHSCRRLLMLSLLAFVAIAGPSANVHGQTTSSQPHFAMTVKGQSLTAGFNNTVTISLVNSYYGAIYDTDIAVSLPSALTLVGDNHWHYDSIALGQNVTITFRVYAPTSAIGTTNQGSITATYRQLGDVSYTTETHALGLSVYGYINLVVYAVQLTPSTTTPGGNATVSGNVLNNGNLAAYNANVTANSDILVPSSSSSAFIGEVDPNIPRPFSLVAFFKPNLSPGNYSLTVIVSATDQSRPSHPIIGHQAAQIEIRRPTQQPTFQRQQSTGLIDLIYQILRNLFNAFFGSLTGILTPLGWSATVNLPLKTMLQFTM